METLGINHIAILANLAFRVSARFTDLNTQGMPSYQFNYYLKSLLEEQYIVKNKEGKYELTDSGKMVVSRLDLEKKSQISQSHIHALILCRNQEGLYLLQTRMKHPFFGWSGFPSIQLESNINFTKQVKKYLEYLSLNGDVKYRSTKHILVKTPDGIDFIDDKIFLVFEIICINSQVIDQDIKGTFGWYTKEEVLEMENPFQNVRNIIKEIDNNIVTDFEEIIEEYNQI